MNASGLCYYCHKQVGTEREVCRNCAYKLGFNERDPAVVKSLSVKSSKTGNEKP